jgi:hypothetical protein
VLVKAIETVVQAHGVDPLDNQGHASPACPEVPPLVIGPWPECAMGANPSATAADQLHARGRRQHERVSDRLRRSTRRSSARRCRAVEGHAAAWAPCWRIDFPNGLPLSIAGSGLRIQHGNRVACLASTLAAWVGHACCRPTPSSRCSRKACSMPRLTAAAETPRRLAMSRTDRPLARRRRSRASETPKTSTAADFMPGV